MSKVSCSSCGEMTELRELRACKNCDSYMCQGCYDQNDGYCSSCRDFTLS